MEPKEKFLSLCSDGKNGERPVFQRVFEALEDLAVQLGDAAPTDAAVPDETPQRLPVRLSLEFTEKSATYRLQHPKLKGASVPILSFWASEADISLLPNTIAMGCKPLRDAKVDEKDIQTYGLNLQKADFEKERTKGWRTMTFKQERSDRLGCLFAEDVKCGDINLKALLNAVQSLVLRINTYATPAATPVAPSKSKVPVAV